MYAIMAIIGMFAAGIYGCRAAKRAGEDDNDMICVLLSAGVGALLGCHLLYGLLNLKYLYLIFEAESFKAFLNGISAVFGGGVFYGGLIGGIASGIIYIRAKKLSLPLYSDISAGVIPLFHAFGRIGCFLGGCCYGMESKFGFVYSKAMIAEANGICRFPVQLLESVCNFVIFIIMARLLKKGAFKGRLMGLYLVIYSVLRFSDEFLRGDVARGVFLCLSTSQWISIAAFIVGASILYFGKRKKQRFSA